MNYNIKKRKTVILSITLSFAFIFILLGSLITSGVFDKKHTGSTGTYSPSQAIRLYQNSSHTKLYTNYNETYNYKFQPNNTGYYYIYVDGADLTNVSSGASYTLQPTYEEYNGYTYDYCYKVYLSSYNEYTIAITAESSSIKIIIVK